MDSCVFGFSTGSSMLIGRLGISRHVELHLSMEAGLFEATVEYGSLQHPATLLASDISVTLPATVHVE